VLLSYSDFTTVADNEISDNVTGVSIEKGSDDTLVTLNTITDNSGKGVAVVSGVRNAIITNSISDNGNGGQADGIFLVEANNANNSQQPPVVDSVTTDGLQKLISGHVTGFAAGKYLIQLFGNPTGPSTQGKVFLGAVTITVTASGTATFALDFTPPEGVNWVDATATRLNGAGGGPGDTSTFSNAVRVTTIV
jgi:hypothetical protein